MGAWAVAGWGMAGAAVLGAAAGATRYAVKARSSQVFGRSVWRGSGDCRAVALTFDDGPSLGTPELLDYLAEQGVRATFFQCGMNAERLPAVARAVAAAGHEIGNHTYSHARLCPRLGWRLNLRSPAQNYDEVARAQAVLQRLGIEPLLLRAPYGMRWFGLRRAQRQFGLFGVMWTVIGRDWEDDADAVASLVLRKARPGAIVCLHDGRDTRADVDIGTTLAAVRQIVPELKRRGYRFLTVTELLRS